MRVEIKYAPQSLNDVVYPNKATELRVKAYGSGELEGHVMLYDPMELAKQQWESC